MRSIAMHKGWIIILALLSLLVLYLLAFSPETRQDVPVPDTVRDIRRSTLTKHAGNDVAPAFRSEAPGNPSTTTDAANPLLVQVLVISEDLEQAISGVTVSLLGRNSAGQSATTDAEGRCSIEVESVLEDVSIEVRAPGFVTEFIAIKSLDTAPYIVRMTSSERVVRGLVVTSDGGPIPEGVGVLCWERQKERSDEFLYREHGVLRADVESNGEFELHGLPERVPVCLMAGGQLWSSAQPLVVDAEGQEVVLTIRPVFVGHLLFRNYDGEPLPDISGGSLSYSLENNQLYELVGRDSAVDAVSGAVRLRWADREVRRDWRDEWFVALGDSRASRDVALNVTYDVPGFDVVRRRLMLSHDSESFRESEIRLAPISGGFGMVQLSLSGLHGGSLDSFVGAFLGKVVLTGRHLRKGYIEAPVWADHDGQISVLVVPQGVYEGYFMVNHWWSRNIAGPGGSVSVDVQNGDYAKAFVHVEDMGALRIDGVDVGGTPGVPRALSVTIIRESGRRVRLPPIMGPIYRVWGIPSGTYGVTLETSLGSSSKEEVRVEAGQETAIEMD